jgi:MFS family permease
VLSFNRRVQLLLLNQFTIKLGFNMLMPFLAGHLTQGLGYGAWAVSLILSVRNISQRGLCLVGGHLADRMGCKRAIVAGCALRTAGFALLGTTASLPSLVVASSLTGFAGALFDPGVRTYLADEAGTRTEEAFGLFNVAGQLGLLLGPLVGLVLDFRILSIASAGVFGLLTLLQARALPAAGPVSATTRPDWRLVLGNRRFLAFAATMTVSYVLSFQVYLALPLVMHSALGDEQDSGMGQMFALSAILVILGQSRVTAWARRRWSPVQCMMRGLAVLSAAFLPLVAVSHPAPVHLGGEEMSEIIGISPILLAAVILAIGAMLVAPFEMGVIVALARNRLVATHYGLYATLSGIGITVGGLVTGSIWDLAARHGLGQLPWVALVVFGCCGALGLATLERAGRLPASP